jgi:hypothetical protein
MLNHTVIPRLDGTYWIAYPTPGCTVPTIAMICRTEEAAQREADRLNERQQQLEEAGE